MINAIEGIPGSGKSYEAVAYHILPALKAGRKVITNLPLNIEAFASIDPSYVELIEIRTKPAPRIGDWNAANIAEHAAFTLWQDKPPEPQPESIFTFGTVWDYFSEWRSVNDKGPLYVIDECHVSLPKKNTPDEVVQWYKLHRHFNADVLLLTQSFRDINQPIAQLIGTLIKCRKADILGDPSEYVRKVHAGYRGANIQTDKRKYEQKYFNLYKSNTQSNSNSESSVQDVSPFVVKLRRFTWFFWIIAAAYFVYAFWPDEKSNIWGLKSEAQKPTKKIESYKKPEIANKQNNQFSKEEKSIDSDSQKKPDEIKDPLYGKVLHITGDMQNSAKRIITFVVSSEGRRIFDLTSDDLLEAGYKVERLANCMAVVKWQGVVRMATCDAPYTASGRGDKPIVIDSSTGGRSDRSPPLVHQPPSSVVAQQVPQASQQPQAPSDGYSAALARRNAQVRSTLMN